MDEYGWASAVGKLRILEKGFLTRTDLSQLASSGSLSSALSALRDSGYGPFVSSVPMEDFDSALQMALQSEYNTIMSLAYEPFIIVAFRARHDFHNLKVYAKSDRLGMALETQALSPAGNLSPDGLGVLCRAFHWGGSETNGPLALLGKDIRRIYGETAKFSGDSDESDAVLALKMDAWIDKMYFSWYREKLGKLGYETLDGFVSLEIDITNLRMFLRARKQGIPQAIMGEVFLSDGSISKDRLSAAFGASGLEGLSIYAGTVLDGLAGLGKEAFLSGAGLTSWERQCDDFFTKYVKRAKNVPMGPEPAFGYIYGREIEARNLRVILSGKQSSVSSEEILERLREPYV